MNKKRIYMSLVIILVLISGAYFSLHFPKKNAQPAPVPTPINLTSNVQKKCPVGFILVPGNTLYQTNDFCVMKYDAKCANSSDSTQGLAPAKGSTCTNEGTYKNNGVGCACTGNRQVVSTPTGFPITYIPETSSDINNAMSYCARYGWHLISNNEWMTIARNVETVPENWCDKDGTHCGFPPGTSGKILVNGHNDNSAQALTESNDDQPCFGTTTDGSNTCGGKSSQKRTLVLNNGEIIWDLAGNVWQWVDAKVLRHDQPQSQSNGKLDHGWMWSEFAKGAKATVIIDNGSGSSLGYDSFRPTNADWNSTNGVGRVYHYSSLKDNNSTTYTFIRGGNWRHGYDSGAFTIHMSPEAIKENIDDVGFRCAYFL